jgi:hypothetical protein
MDTYKGVQNVSNCIYTQFKSAMLKQFFDDRIISKKLWPSRSPNPTPPDYFLWGYLKHVLYSNRPQTIEDLKQNSEAAISNISQETLKKSSAKHGGTCEYMLRRKWRSFSTYTVKSCKLFFKYVFVRNKLL